MKSIRELRKRTGLSQSKFAEKYKLSTKQVQSWEQGQRNVPESTLYLLNRCVDEDFKMLNTQYTAEQLRNMTIEESEQILKTMPKPIITLEGLKRLDIGVYDSDGNLIGDKEGNSY